MAQLGTFTEAPDGSYRGSIRSLTLNTDLEIRPIEPPMTAKRVAPTHHVYAADLEVGAAWSRVSEDGRPYLSVKLDDPAFPAPIYVTLSQGAATGELVAVWSRPGTARFHRTA